MFVDFENLPHKYETMIHLPFEEVTPLLEKLYRAKLLDATEVILRPPLTGCEVAQPQTVRVPDRLCIVFENAGGKGSTLKAFWALLHRHKIEITWKHETQGHTIGAPPDFPILRSWELDDGMC